MKQIKKLLAIVVTLCCVFSVSTIVYASGADGIDKPTPYPAIHCSGDGRIFVSVEPEYYIWPMWHGDHFDNNNCFGDVRIERCTVCGILSREYPDIHVIVMVNCPNSWSRR